MASPDDAALGRHAAASGAGHAARLEALVLVDAGALGRQAPSPPRLRGEAPVHRLDSPGRVAGCCQAVRRRRPGARILIFLGGDGYRRMWAEWHKLGPSAPLKLDVLHCVPFGCRLSSALAELAEAKASEGCDVAVVSNDADIVVRSQLPGTRWRHQGFMFVEGHLILPAQALDFPRVLLNISPPGSVRGVLAVRGTASRSRSPRRQRQRQASLAAQGGVSQPLAVPARASDPARKAEVAPTPRAPATVMPWLPAAALAAAPRECDGGDETMRDSQARDLDGAPIESGCFSEVARSADLEFADTQVEVDIPMVDDHSPSQLPIADDDAYVDTQIEVASAWPQARGRAAGEVVALASSQAASHPGVPSEGLPPSDLDVNAATEAAGSPAPVAQPPSQGAPIPSSPWVAPEEELRCDEAPLEAAEEKEQKEADQNKDTVAMEEEAAAQAALAEASPKKVVAAETVSGTTVAESASSQRALAKRTPPTGTTGLKSGGAPRPPLLLANGASVSAQALLGRWQRDGGKTHVVVSVPGPAGSFLEFRPSEAEGGDGAFSSLGLPILWEDGAWSLNGFQLAAAEGPSDLEVVGAAASQRSEADAAHTVLRWTKPATGAARKWWRPGAAGAAVPALPAAAPQ